MKKFRSFLLLAAALFVLGTSTTSCVKEDITPKEQVVIEDEIVE